MESVRDSLLVLAFGLIFYKAAKLLHVRYNASSMAKLDDKKIIDDYYYEVEFTGLQRYALFEFLKGGKLTAAMKKEIFEALSLSRKIEGPLVREPCDWADIHQKALEQGISEADVVYDMIGKGIPE